MPAKVPSRWVFLRWVVQASQLFQGVLPTEVRGLYHLRRFLGLVGCCPLLANLP